MSELMERYREMLARGICAHAAAVHVVNLLYMQAKERGLSFNEATTKARRLLTLIRAEWEN